MQDWSPQEELSLESWSDDTEEEGPPVSLGEEPHAALGEGLPVSAGTLSLGNAGAVDP